MLSHRKSLPETTSQDPTELALSISNLEKMLQPFKNLDPNKLEIHIPWCLGYKASLNALTPEKMRLLIEMMNERNYKFTVYLAPREKTKKEAESPLDIFKRENAALLQEIEENPLGKLSTELDWRETDTWQKAEKRYQEFMSKKNEEIENALIQDIKKKQRSRPEWKSDSIREHCIACAIDVIAYALNNNDNKHVNAFIYPDSLPQIVHHATLNLNTNKILNPDIEKEKKISLYRLKPIFKEVRLNQQEKLENQLSGEKDTSLTATFIPAIPEKNNRSDNHIDLFVNLAVTCHRAGMPSAYLGEMLASMAGALNSPKKSDSSPGYIIPEAPKTHQKIGNLPGKTTHFTREEKTKYNYVSLRHSTIFSGSGSHNFLPESPENNTTRIGIKCGGGNNQG